MITLQTKYRLTALSFFCYLLTGGLIVLTGMVIKPLAAYFNVDISVAGGVFKWMNLGMLVAIVCNSFLMDIIPLKRQIFIGTALIVIIFIGLMFVKNMFAFSILMFFFGLVAGIEMSIGTYLVACMYEGKTRGMMLLLTDSFFSLAGIAFPLIAGFMLDGGMSWSMLYVMVLISGIAVFLLSLGVPFPSPAEVQQIEKGQPIIQKFTREVKQWGSAVYLLFFGCMLYILGQLCFVFWIPTYVEKNFAVSAEVAARPLSFFWIGMWIGLYLSSAIVKRFPMHIFVAIIAICTTVTFFMLRSTPELSLLKYECLLMGFFSSGIYYTLITLTSLQVPVPSPLLVNLALTSGTLGTFLTPVVTAKAVDAGGPAMALTVGNLCYLLVFIVAVLVIFTTRHQQHERVTNNQ
ncbi:MAG: MFS transporter TsgA [Endozoicomonadaceae bacterium]|nr:MFS transporter TsgA [Endozoicomonadaceae bacterium]